MSAAASAADEQLAYYRAVADEYEDHAIDAPGQDELFAAIDSFRPTGDVLELACGPGVWTERLERSAASVTAVDGAPEMLARARSRLGAGASVRFVEADLFSWHPDRRYDAVYFGFWISHVPEDRFESFWHLVGQALEPDGRVFFFDDNHRTDVELAEGIDSPIVRRELNDGTPFRVTKIPYQPAELERRLRDLNWDITVSGTSGPFYWGTGGRYLARGPSDAGELLGHNPGVPG
ncbi:MAG: class I SAM-dependent methyltransferase [Actinomycetota bacterium]|nr:class I SAM-dependent methyltransferase [Actinomycetota bacterium]